MWEGGREGERERNIVFLFFQCDQFLKYDFDKLWKDMQDEVVRVQCCMWTLPRPRPQRGVVWCLMTTPFFSIVYPPPFCHNGVTPHKGHLSNEDTSARFQVNYEHYF